MKQKHIRHKLRFEGHELYKLETFDVLKVPYYASNISAGFPSLADDYLDERINLNEFLVKNPADTYMLKVRGNSMEDANIKDGAILIIDRLLEPENGRIAVCYLENNFTVKTIRKREGRLFLEPANAAYPAIEVTEGMRLQVLGVVTFIIIKAEEQ
ncbi:translesion error-prone DNA polymerase V autoproteolytic subunit [Pontibacter qinzhouensis]|uniref:Translesion error-prone DNA polymerase V autoproteolytic subunit n=1 Tax=Pontibacter qinzhouensis TaxID=2603253 RepID=A0A5C8IRP3_9BACT|nr:translesion error-prone DNA polymerase V autoproteolytic subunit [Pontibacter qinzhouensis]TXK23595.1 translesion error-prone DNA polymerase V autoproteolytic subunit [Pontibacter qinzhouensis]